jgi:hypothetical protein
MAYKNPTYHKEYYAKHKSKILPYVKEYRRTHKDQLKNSSERAIWNRKLECIKQYGNKCQCCGESMPEFLSIVVNGVIERLDSARIFLWIKTNKFPTDGIELLCFNCHYGRKLKRNKGICPHKQPAKQKWSEANIKWSELSKAL